MEGAGRRGEQQVLGEHVQPAGAGRIAIQFACGNAGNGRLTFQHLEAVGGHEDRPARFVHAVVGAADALQQAADAFGRADLDHLVHAAPVDPEIQRGGGHDSAQLAAGHGGFHAQALGEIQAAVVQADRQCGVVELPELLEQQLALRAGVDEYDRHAGLFDPGEDGAGGGEPHAAGPGDALFGQHHAQRRRCALPDFDQPRRAAGADISKQGGRMRDRGGEADAARAGGQCGEACEAEGQLIAPLGAGHGMDFVDDDGGEAREEGGRGFLGEQDGEALRSGEQDVGWGLPLLAALLGGGVAGAGVDADGQAELFHRVGQVAGDIGRQRLQRADI